MTVGVGFRIGTTKINLILHESKIMQTPINKFVSFIMETDPHNFLCMSKNLKFKYSFNIQPKIPVITNTLQIARANKQLILTSMQC